MKRGTGGERRRTVTASLFESGMSKKQWDEQGGEPERSYASCGECAVECYTISREIMQDNCITGVAHVLHA